MVLLLFLLLIRDLLFLFLFFFFSPLLLLLLLLYKTLLLNLWIVIISKGVNILFKHFYKTLSHIGRKSMNFGKINCAISCIISLINGNFGLFTFSIIYIHISQKFSPFFFEASLVHRERKGTLIGNSGRVVSHIGISFSIPKAVNLFLFVSGFRLSLNEFTAALNFTDEGPFLVGSDGDLG